MLFLFYRAVQTFDLFGDHPTSFVEQTWAMLGSYWAMLTLNLDWAMLGLSCHENIIWFCSTISQPATPALFLLLVSLQDTSSNGLPVDTLEEAFKWHYHLVNTCVDSYGNKALDRLAQNLAGAVWYSQYSILLFRLAVGFGFEQVFKPWGNWKLHLDAAFGLS